MVNLHLRFNGGPLFGKIFLEEVAWGKEVRFHQNPCACSAALKKRGEGEESIKIAAWSRNSDVRRFGSLKSSRGRVGLVFPALRRIDGG